MDALQAYICSVRLERYHDGAWFNLGLLYESCNQSKDALIAFTNALEILKPSTNQEILQKIQNHGKIINENQTNPESKNNNNNSSKMIPNIEEAWRLPIPHELINRLKPMNFGFSKIPQQNSHQHKPLLQKVLHMERQQALEDKHFVDSELEKSVKSGNTNLQPEPYPWALFPTTLEILRNFENHPDKNELAAEQQIQGDFLKCRILG